MNTTMVTTFVFCLMDMIILFILYGFLVFGENTVVSTLLTTAGGVLYLITRKSSVEKVIRNIRSIRDLLAPKYSFCDIRDAVPLTSKNYIFDSEFDANKWHGLTAVSPTVEGGNFALLISHTDVNKHEYAVVSRDGELLSICRSSDIYRSERESEISDGKFKEYYIVDFCEELGLPKLFDIYKNLCVFACILVATGILSIATSMSIAVVAGIGIGLFCTKYVRKALTPLWEKVHSCSRLPISTVRPVTSPKVYARFIAKFASLPTRRSTDVRRLVNNVWGFIVKDGKAFKIVTNVSNVEGMVTDVVRDDGGTMLVKTEFFKNEMGMIPYVKSSSTDSKSFNIVVSGNDDSQIAEEFHSLYDDFNKGVDA